MKTMNTISLQQLEQTLEEIQTLGGVSLDELERQVEESRNILQQMSQNKKADLLQNLMTVVLAMDKDGNMMLSNEEIDELIQTLEGIHGVRLKEDLLKKIIIDNGRSLKGIMEVARQLVTEDKAENDRVFEFLTDEDDIRWGASIV